MPEFIFILYKPAVPGNIGASARAIKTMGFSLLRLIQPCDHLNDEARKMAHGSHDILEEAQIFESFEAGISDLDYLICTTAKNRSTKFDYYSSREVTAILKDKAGSLQKIGIIFGTEESGLPNNIIQHSDLAVTIPMKAGYPSLNLSQSVMIIAYELSWLNILRTSGARRLKNTQGFSELKQRTQFLLEIIGIPPGTPLHHRIMERVALLKSGDIALLHSVTARLMSALTD
ncbi:MAG TPA: tRNA/rRNA methyltransferase [Bacteroidaceae bacterium]|nr:tRNA/rRNA methyltransferase [Bacteroidaceae bacterium]